MSKDTNIPPGYKPSPLGPIPQDWEVKKLLNVGKPYIGLTYKPEQIVNSGGTLVLRSSNIQNSTIVFDDNVYVECDIPERALVKDGDILICVRNGSRSLIGKSARILAEHVGMSYGAFMSVFRSDINDYLIQLFHSGIFQREINKNIGATINQITSEDLNNFIIPLPPLPEQKAIADVLSTWDEAIKTTTQLITAKEQRKQYLMQTLLTGKKRLKGFEGEKWSIKRLGEVFDERNERGVENLPLLSIGSSGVYPQSESAKKDTSNEDKSKYLRICPDDIGYNTMRMWQGRSALSALEGIVSPAYTILKPQKNVSSLYFSYLFKTEPIIHLFYRNSQGLVDDTLNCKYKDFSIIKVSIPNYKEQTAIAAVLQTADAELQLLNDKLTQLKHQKKGLMQQLLTGKKRLNINKN